MLMALESSSLTTVNLKSIAIFFAWFGVMFGLAMTALTVVALVIGGLLG